MIKTVRNIRKHGQNKETDADKGMYRPDIKLDLERSILLTESYKQTEGEPIIIRRAKALDHILTNMTLNIQDWEIIVGNNMAAPQGLFFGIGMNWRSVRRIVDQEEAKNRFGIACRGDGSGISATYAAGAALPATPDGRRAGEPLSDATLSPVFGMDRKGPTAVLKSAGKISTRDTYNHLLNQKFPPEALEGGMKEIFVDYIRAWGDLGISQIQFNVVDPATLRDAQKHPEAHADLLVRVAGYSAYFVDLSKGLQDSIINRTEHHF